MPINASPHFEKAQAAYEQAQTTQQKIVCLKKMIALAPKHKGAENLLKNLKTRLAKLKYTKEKESRSKGSTKKGIHKEDMQAVIIGFTNSGKSSLMNILTKASPKISSGDFNKFTTQEPILGTLNYKSGVQIQLIENPAPDSRFLDKSLINTADTILILITDLQQVNQLESYLKNAQGKKIIIFNKTDLLSDKEKRKISETLKSKYKKYDFILISTKTKEGLDELKSKLFQSFGKIRVYTKEPNKKEKSPKAIVMEPNSTVKDVAEKILHGFSKRVVQTKIWGPSSKFPGQKVGLKHELKDLDIVEFKTR
ncbi:MAG: GTPase [Candidatus Nanoarchaeia archaeon]